jgi:hypothetical protein
MDSFKINIKKADILIRSLSAGRLEMIMDLDSEARNYFSGKNP